MTIAAIAREFGVHPNTIRHWIDPEAYRRSLEHAASYHKAHPYRNANRELKDRRNAYQRQRWANNPVVRAKLYELAAKYRGTAQGYIAAKIRSCTLGHAGRYSPIHTAFMEAVTGMTKRAFTIQWDWPGTFDHIVPLCAFDLTKPEHLVRAMYPRNLRLIPARDNQAKGDAGRDVDVMQLPWVGTDAALVAAQAFILRCLSRAQP